MSNQIQSILEKIDLSKKDKIPAILAESLGDADIKVGTEVAVIGEADGQIYPFDGCRGKVKSIENGYAEVEFENGTVAPCLINLLLKV